MSEAASGTTRFDPQATRDLVFHLDNLFHARVHTLMAAEAILFLAVAVVWNDDDVRRGVSIFAIALTAVVFVANINLANKLRWTMARWEEVEPSGLVRDYARQRVRLAGLQLPRSITLYAWAIPSLLVIAWLLIAMTTMGTIPG